MFSPKLFVKFSATITGSKNGIARGLLFICVDGFRSSNAKINKAAIQIHSIYVSSFFVSFESWTVYIFSTNSGVKLTRLMTICCFGVAWLKFVESLILRLQKSLICGFWVLASFWLTWHVVVSAATFWLSVVPLAWQLGIKVCILMQRLELTILPTLLNKFFFWRFNIFWYLHIAICILFKLYINIQVYCLLY